MRALVFAAMFFMQGVPQQRIQPGVVTGQVRMADGSPAVGIRVAAQLVTEGVGQGGGTMLSALAQTDDAGRYRLESVLPGRYYIIAGRIEYPTYYPGVKTLADGRIVTVEPGSSVVSIDFALARPASGIRVSGRVTGLPAGLPSGLFKIVLQLPGVSATPRLDGPVRSDGSFEFLRVAPGRYSIHLVPSPLGPPTVPSMIVDDTDISGLEIPALDVRIGRVIVENGGSLPLHLAEIAAGLPDPSALLRFQARPAGKSVGRATTANVRSDGLFVWSLPAGEYQVGILLLPIGYYVKTMSYGPTDLLKTSLKVVDPSSSEIQVTVTVNPPGSAPQGVTVSGRLNDLPERTAGPVWISIQSNPPRISAPGLTEIRIGETLLRSDGTFQIPNVPSGAYTIQPVTAGNGSIPLFQSFPSQNIVVADRDVSGVELKLGSR